MFDNSLVGVSPHVNFSFTHHMSPYDYDHFFGELATREYGSDDRDLRCSEYPEDFYSDDYLIV
jgi:hypothetical protein